MDSISRYIFKQLVIVSLFITLGLTFAVWLTQSLRLFEYIVNRGLPASAFLGFVGLLLPSFLGVVLPIAAFCAVLFVYNKMIMDSEMVVMRAAGISHLQLARPAILLGICVTLVVYAITLYFLPLSYRAFKDVQYELRNDYATVLLQEGVFNTLSDGITVYVRERTGDGELQGILVHDNRDPEAPVTMMAERGALIRTEEGPRVIMVNGNRQEVNRGEGKLALLHFDRYTVELKEFTDAPQARRYGVKERFLGELFWPSDVARDDERFRQELRAEGHRRLSAPLYTLAFVFVGLAALLSGEFNRRGQLRRILLAILCVGLLEALALTFHDLSSQSPGVIPLMYVSALLPVLICLYILLMRPARRPARQASLEGAPT